jgi:hypothetical protein
MSYIAAGNTITTALIYNADTTGNLVFTTGGANTVALTLSNTQAATFANNVTVSGALTTANGTGSINSINTFGFKNRIINGGMTIDQRNAGASVTPTNTTYTLDRWSWSLSQTSKLTSQQNAGSVTPPVGFTNYLGVTSSSSYSVTSSDYFAVGEAIEVANVSDLGWGTANAKTVTLSFWVYSSLTGTFGGSLINYGAYNYSYPFSYAVSSANTWTQISVTIIGPTSGTWTTTSNSGLIYLRFGLGSGSSFSATAGSWQSGNFVQSTGSTSVVGTSGATFYITGVQLEVGSQATSFDFRDYGRELILCQRYYFTNGGINMLSAHPASIYARINYFLPVAQRTTGTTTFKDAAGTSGVYTSYSAADTATNGVGAIAFGAVNNQVLQILLSNTDSGVNAGFSYTSSAEL